MWTEQRITMQLNFTFFTFIKSNANQSCLFWNIHVAPNTMFKGNDSCILLYKIQRCWFLSFFCISLIIFPLPWNHLWQNQITADWLLYWWKMRHISFQEMCDNTIWFMNANRFLVEVKFSTSDICVTMKACFICCSLLQVFNEEVSAWCKRGILNIFIADSAPTEYCTTFQCPCVCHRRDISHFSHI